MTAPKTRADLERAGYKLENLGTCSSLLCKQRIQWVITPAGKRSPYDLMPQAESPAVSHFATCVDQARFRRKA
jgi:hypothetical protein